MPRGAPLATVFSSALADAQTRYLSMRAMLEAEHKKLERTERLVVIGAARRQELEEVTAVHVGQGTEAASARQRLLLLGLTRQEIDDLTDPGKVVSQVVVPAPIGGVVTARSANPGLRLAPPRSGFGRVPAGRGRGGQIPSAQGQTRARFGELLRRPRRAPGR